ncbi:MAG: DUF3667 domain-containing protein [Acidobacteriota bacterium]
MKLPGDDVVLRTLEPVLEGDGQGPVGVRCPNCGAEFAGPYCHVCGQKAGDLHISLREFFREAISSLFSFDSRLWSTLKALLRHPGQLTLDYWEGKRARYLPPLRLYLFVSFVAFLIFGATGNSNVVNINSDGGIAPVQVQGSAEEIDWEEQAEDTPRVIQLLLLNVVRPAVEEPERLRELFFQRLPWAVFLLVPFFAVLLRVLYRKVDRYLVPHLIFSLHFHTTTFILLALSSLSEWMIGSEAASLPFSLAIVVTLYIALRRAYGSSRIKTFLKLCVLGFTHLMTLSFVLLGTLLASTLSLS